LVHGNEGEGRAKRDRERSRSLPWHHVTKVERTPLANLPGVSAKERELYGPVGGLYPPNFKGHLATDQDREYLTSKGLPELPYVEPYLYNLMRHRNGPCDDQVLDRALADLKDDYAPSMFDNVRILTDYEALRGVPGSLFRPMNLQTGAGHPFYGVKSALITFDDAAKTVWVHPLVVKAKDQLLELMDLGIVPLNWSSAVPKDEAMEWLKAMCSDARMINVVCLAYIWLYRKYCYPLDCVDFMDSDSMENRIGINCADPAQVEMFVQSLLTFPNHTDEDAAAFDVRQNTQFSNAVSLLHDWQAVQAGYCPVSRQRVFCLSRMAWNFVKEIKGELYYFRYSNPSGDPSTTARNGKVNRLADRYGLYYAIPRSMWHMKYTQWFKLATFGDDRAKAIHDEALPYLAAMQAAVADTGLVFTSGSNKNVAVEVFRGIEGRSFLKRTFRCENGLWLMALSQKSILGMLTTRYRGSLSATDHYAVLLSTALLESSFHSREVFAEWRTLVDASQAYLSTINVRVERSSFWKVLTFEEYRAAYLARTLSYWTPVVEPVSQGFYALDQPTLEKIMYIYMCA